MLQAQTTRPKIGFAFGGGGAKGIAEIGVLKVLEEAGIRPDYITGTSIGSIVGGLYAIGYSVEDLEKLSKELDWNYYFNDEINRIDLPIEERLNTDRYQIKLNIEDGKIKLPGGFVQGKKIGLLLSQLTLPVHGINNFDEFNIPFRCVAADFETGAPVVLGKGSLAKAIRASMSIPSVFEPIEIDGKLLIDGGVVRNLPVQEVKAMGADIIIAIDVTSPLYKKDELSSFVTVLEQSGSYRLAESIKEAKEMADIFIHPEIDDFGALDFTNNDTLLALGEKAAREQLPKILKLINQSPKSVAPRRQKKMELPESYDIQEIFVKGTSKDSKQLSDKIANINTKKGLSIQQVEDRIKVLFGSNYIRDAYYEVIENENGGYELDIDANLQSGKYIQVSAGYDSDLKAGLLLNATYQSKGFRGAKLSMDLRLSEYPLLLAEYKFYTNSNSIFGFKIHSQLNHYPTYFYNEAGDLSETLNINHYNLGLGAFSALGRHIKLTLGVGVERYMQRIQAFKKDTEDLQFDQAYVNLNLIRDTYDRYRFPSSGSFFSLDGKFAYASQLKISRSDNKIDYTKPNVMARLQYNKVFPVEEKFAIKWYNDAGVIFSEEDNYLNLFYLGRAIPSELTHVEFVGLDFAELPVTAYALTGLKLRYEPKTNIFTSLLFNYGYYETLPYISSLKGNTITTKAVNKKIVGMGGELGFITPIGPGSMTMEYNLEEKRVNFSLHLGYFF
jgi:NTE family protein